MGRMLKLVWSMYEPKPNYSSISQAQRLQLLVLADRYQVSKVLAAVCSTLAALPIDQLQWKTVTGVHKLPAGCADAEAFKGVYVAAAAKKKTAGARRFGANLGR